MEPVSNRGLDDARAVDDAVSKTDAGSLGMVMRRAGNLADPEAEMQRLGDDLVVEDKVVRAGQQRQPLQHLAAPGPGSGVILGKRVAEHRILERPFTSCPSITQDTGPGAAR